MTEFFFYLIKNAWKPKIFVLIFIRQIIVWSVFDVCTSWFQSQSINQLYYLWNLCCKALHNCPLIDSILMNGKIFALEVKFQAHSVLFNRFYSVRALFICIIYKFIYQNVLICLNWKKSHNNINIHVTRFFIAL